MRWITRSFRNLLVAALAGLVLVLGVPTFLYVTIAHTQQLVQERGHMLDYIASTAATLISENLRERSREVELLAQSSLLAAENLDNAALQQTLERMQHTYTYYSWIGLADMQGIVQVATDNLLTGLDVSARPWFQEAKQGMYVGDLHEAKLLAKLLPPLPGAEGPLRFIDFSVRISNPQGQPRAILGAHAHWQWSSDLIKLVTPPDAEQRGVELFIIDKNNQVILPDTPLPEGELHQVPVIAHDSGAHYYSWGSEKQFLTAVANVVSPPSTIPLDWRVMVRQPRDQVLQQVIQLQRVIITVFGLALLAFALLAGLLGRQLGRPLQQLTRIAQAISQGRPASFDVRVRTNELKELIQALQQMSSRFLEHQKELEAAARTLEHKVELRTQELAEANKRLTDLARKDTLTGLPNRLASTEFLQHEFQQLARRSASYAIIMLDIDYFKRVNDTYGHATGDKVLQHVAAVLASSIRANDFVGRVGGEEFMAVLPTTELVDAAKVAEKIRAAVEASPVEGVGRITISVGVAQAHLSDTHADTAVNLADAMLYKAKHQGRNRVVTAVDSTSDEPIK